MPATGLRALIQQDPALLWLKFEARRMGSSRTRKSIQFLNWIGEEGARLRGGVGEEHRARSGAGTG